MSEKHTPGPWVLSGKAKRQNGCSYFSGGIVGSDNTTVVVSSHYVGICGKKPANVSANARLIAAAPELLAALRRIAEVCEAEGSPLALSVAKTARDAISKTTGDPPCAGTSGT